MLPFQIQRELYSKRLLSKRDGMVRLPLLPARKILKALQTLGFEIHHQKGSHIVLKNADDNRMIVVPDHKEVDRGTLRSILKQGKIDLEEFLNILVILR